MMDVNIENFVHELISFKKASSKLQKYIICYCDSNYLNVIIEILFNLELFAELSSLDRNKLQKKKRTINRLLQKKTSDISKRKILLDLLKIGILNSIISSFVKKCCNVC
jgi:hypothetical protein